MVKGDELIKYITERVVTYIETPRDERIRYKESAKIQRGRWEVRWFGMMPLALVMWVRAARAAWRSFRRRRVGRTESRNYAEEGAENVGGLMEKEG